MRNLIIPGLVLAFTVYCLVDVIRSEQSEVRGLPKLVWAGLVLLFPLAGGAAWFLAGRPRTSRPPGTQRIGTPKPRTLGPDDDADFLRTIDRPRPVAPADPIDTGSTSPPGPPDGGTAVQDRDDGDGTTGQDGDTGQDGPTGQDETGGRDDRTT